MADIDPVQELSSLYQAKKANQQTLSQRLAEFDKYKAKVEPIAISATTDMSGVPAGYYNPMNELGNLISSLQAGARQRQGYQSEIASNEDQMGSLLTQIAGLQQKSGSEKYNALDKLKIMSEAQKLGQKVTGWDANGEPTLEPMAEGEMAQSIEFTGGNKTKAGTLLGLGKSISDLESVYKPAYSGVAQRGYQELRGALGTPEAGFEDYRSNISSVTNAMLAYISGAQISPEEAKRLMTQIPSPADSDARVASKINYLKKYIANNIGGILASENQTIDPVDYLKAKIGLDPTTGIGTKQNKVEQNKVDINKEIDNMPY